MGQSIITVDAFTNRPFAGNPAAVCVLDGPADESWMQAVAREMNLSETAFTHHATGTEPGLFHLRWFTPTVEVDLCGHATLATAHVLWTEGHLLRSQPAKFLTKGGALTAELAEKGWITLDFPSTPVSAERPADLDALGSLLGLPVKNAAFSCRDLLIELESEGAVRALAPNFRALASIEARGVIVTAAASTPGIDFVSRFFAPALGIDEDPVCGSAHCCLGPYWAERLLKPDLAARQISQRGGELKVAVHGDRVRLSGQAITTVRGVLAGTVPPMA